MNSRPIKPEDLVYILDRCMLVNYHIKRMPDLLIHKSTFYSYKKYIIAKIIGDISEGLYKDSEIPVTFTVDNIAAHDIDGGRQELVSLTVNVGDTSWEIHQKQWSGLNKFIKSELPELSTVAYARSNNDEKYPPIDADELYASYIEMINRLAACQWSIYDRLDINTWSRMICNVYKGLTITFIREIPGDQNSLDGFHLKMKTPSGKTKALDVFTRHKTRKRIAAILYANFGQGPNYNFKESIKTPYYKPEYTTTDDEHEDNKAV